MFTPMIGIGIGADYIQASTETKIIYTQASYSGEATIKPNASAIPLKLSLYLCLPAGSGFRMNFNAGIGYYLAMMSNSVRQESGSHFFEDDNQAKAKGFGFHGGLGFEFDLSSQVGLFIEAQGRYANFGGFKGDYYYKCEAGTVDHDSGTLYYFEEWGLLPLFYPVIFVKTAPPIAMPDCKNIREAKIDYSGGAVLGGIVIRF
jgi:opacity protein-like surface antigen